MNDHGMSERLSRRRLGMGALLTAGVLMTRSVAGGEKAAAFDLTGDCGSEPGVQLLLDWSLGRPVLQITELAPPASWAQYSHPTLPLFFRYPPDWLPVALWAETFSANGMPIWLDQPVPLPQLVSGRIISPDGYASFEFTAGTITGYALTTEQSAMVAKQGIVGELPRLTSICTHEIPAELEPGWFHADMLDASVLVSYGWPRSPTSGLYATTTLTYYTLFGPQEQFEELMRTVYIPILSQLEGGGDTPTPTPTP
jgi:hypothetical protein